MGSESAATDEKLSTNDGVGRVPTDVGNEIRSFLERADSLLRSPAECLNALREAQKLMRVQRGIPENAASDDPLLLAIGKRIRILEAQLIADAGGNGGGRHETMQFGTLVSQ